MPDAAAPCDPPALNAGLRLHLQHAPLTTVTMQVGARQQSYVALMGCVVCTGGLPGGCLPGCRVDLLQRLLRAAWPGVTLQRAPSGLMPRAYTRWCPMEPTARAQPVTSAGLAAWSEARLILHWPQQATGLRVAGLLAVGADGPDPMDVVTAQGWARRRLPALLLRQWVRQPIPPALWAARAWPGAPLLMPPTGAIPDTAAPAVQAEDAPGAGIAEAPTPAVVHDGGEVEESRPPTGTDLVHPDVHDGGTAALRVLAPNAASAGAAVLTVAPATSPATSVAERLAAHLAPLIVVDPDADEAFVARWGASMLGLPMPAPAPLAPLPSLDDDRPADVETVDDPDESIWPRGPGGMRPADVGDLLAALATSLIVQGDEPGLSRKRLVQLLPDTHVEYARQLLVWFDRAGLLVPPLLPDAPFRAPRPLQDMAAGERAERLRATPIPSSADARAAMQ